MAREPLPYMVSTATSQMQTSNLGRMATHDQFRSLVLSLRACRAVVFAPGGSSGRPEKSSPAALSGKNRRDRQPFDAAGLPFTDCEPRPKLTN